MLLIVGLGNPGDKYADNRHNIGFMAVDEVVHRHTSFGPAKSRFQALCHEGTIAGEKVLVVKPQTFMNESGRAVGEAMRFFKLTPGDVVVFHDELDLAPGKMKVKVGGGHAGQNGVRSVISHIGADFARVRLGIGHPGDKARVSGYVLHDFANSDWEWVDGLCETMADSAEWLVRRDWPRFMTEVALKRPRSA